MEYRTLAVEVQDRVALLTLNRPAAGNALNEEMHRELHQAWRDINLNDDIWFTIVRGSGKDFCLGDDLREITEDYRKDGKPERWARDEQWQRKYAAGLEPVFGWPEPTEGYPGKPLIAAVHGRCHGAGLMFVSHADFTLASEDAEFCLPNVDQGLVAVHEILSMTRSNLPRAPILRLALMGKHEVWTAERARQLGLVVEVTPREQLVQRAREYATTIVTRSAPLCVRGARTGWWNMFNLNEGEVSRVQHVYLAEQRVASEDAKEGPRAFAQKRKPDWKAR